MPQSDKPRFAIRTIKNNRVKVFGRFYVSETPLPDHLQVRAVFGLYYTGDKLDDTIVLWGSLDMRKANNLWRNTAKHGMRIHSVSTASLSINGGDERRLRPNAYPIS